MPKFDPEFFTEDAEDYANDFLDSVLDLKSDAAIDQAFAEKVFALPEAERKAVASALDKELFSILEDGLLADIREEGIDALKQSIKDELRDNAEALQGALTANRVVFNIEKLEGRHASPFVKAFAAAVEKSNGAEECAINPLYAIIDAVAAKGLADPNPLRENVKKALNAIRGRLGI